jgi:hypothetical protein
MSFYNTINLSGQDLSRAQAKAMTQKQLVAALFRLNPDKRFSPSQVYTLFKAKYGLRNPITSWRRCFSNLTDEGVLIKGDRLQMILGPEGKPEHTWAYSEAGDTNALQTFFNKLQSGEIEGGPYVPPTPKQFVQKELFA